ncbi:hypothetical protein AVEN_193784-1 [Araneus ventricosus]|uniref:Uncharacterized protein n=1 Tax=Araneus ventricosus TaxID=182803 RepID=A0A4Y2DMV0_ARAVE|nr:hypothetical protein AVEN_193784-1 [Araneus ventricosus]
MIPLNIRRACRPVARSDIRRGAKTLTPPRHTQSGAGPGNRTERKRIIPAQRGEVASAWTSYPPRHIQHAPGPHTRWTPSETGDKNKFKFRIITQKQGDI